jgi:tetratricopeptide (TPR) repeat protein
MRLIVAGVVRTVLTSAALLAPHPADAKDDFGVVRADLRSSLARGEWEGVHERIRHGLDRARRDSDAPATAFWRSELAFWALERHVFHREGRESVVAAITDALQSTRPEPLAEAHWVEARLYYRDAFDTRDWTKAKAQVEKARDLWRAAYGDAALADVHNYFGLIEFQQGRLDPAEAEFKRALALARAAGDESVASSVERHLGFVHHRRGAQAEALEMYERSLRGRERLGAAVTIPFARIAVAELLLEWGRESERASSLLRDAADLAERSGSPRAEYTARRRLARLAVAASDVAAARRQLDAALRAAEAFGSPSAVEAIRSERKALDARK